MDSLGRILGPLIGMALYGITISLPFVVSGALSLAAVYLLVRFSVPRLNAELMKKRA
jgi:hypothetical protein